MTWTLSLQWEACKVVFITILLNVALRPTVAYTDPSELKALLALRDVVRQRGGSWLDATKTWTCDAVSCDPCGDKHGSGWGNWKYLGCRSGSLSAPVGRVTNVHLTDLSLEGQVPFSELCQFSELRELDLDGNFLRGPLPEWAPTCWPHLRELDLSWTPIGGELPATLSALRTLEEVKLRYASLRGSIPPELGDMPNLRILALQGNALTGAIPDELATGPAGSSLQQLNLQDNPGIYGRVPEFRPFKYACCWCHWRWCGVYLQGTGADVSATASPVVRWGLTHRAEEPACEPKCPWKAVSDPPPPDVFELERAGVLTLDHLQRWDAGDLPPPDGSTCEERAGRSGCKSMRQYGFCEATCGQWGA